MKGSYQYDAFRNIRCKENIHNRILYTGQQHDQVTGAVLLAGQVL